MLINGLITVSFGGSILVVFFVTVIIYSLKLPMFYGGLSSRLQAQVRVFVCVSQINCEFPQYT